MAAEKLTGGQALAKALAREGVEVISAFQNVSAHRLQALDETVECDVIVLATGFAACCLDYLPMMEEAVRRSKQHVSFTAKVEFWRDPSGAVLGRLSSAAPKIAAESRPKVDFVLQMDRGGQLELVFEGTRRQMEKQIEAKQVGGD